MPLERERRWVRAELCAVPNSRPCGSRRSRGSRTAQTTASVSLSPTSGRSSGSVTRRRRRGWGQAEPPSASPSLGGRYPSHPGNRRSTYPSINNSRRRPLFPWPLLAGIVRRSCGTTSRNPGVKTERTAKKSGDKTSKMGEMPPMRKSAGCPSLEEWAVLVDGAVPHRAVEEAVGLPGVDDQLRLLLAGLVTRHLRTANRQEKPRKD